MHPLLCLAFALAAGSSFANEATRAGLDELWRGSRPLGSTPREPHDPSPADVHARQVQLMERPSLRYLMFFAECPGPDYAAFGRSFPLIPDEVAGPFVLALVTLEVSLAKRYHLPFARVTSETDLLLDLASTPGPLTARRVRERLTSPEDNAAGPSLGPAYDKIFLGKLKSAPVSRYGSAGPALAKNFLSHLVGNLARRAREGRAVFKSPQSDSDVLAWLEAPAPVEVPAARRAPSVPDAVPGAARGESAEERSRRLRNLGSCIKRILD